MIKFIGRYFQKRREERLRQIKKEDAQRGFDQYMRAKRVIMPKADPRDLQQMHQRIVSHG